MKTSPAAPLAKHVLLVGAGNAHLGFVRMFGMRPLPAVAVTLVSEFSVIPYSAMVPGRIAGDYCDADITIDLVRLCRVMNVRFLAARAIRLDAMRRCVHFADRPELPYDVVSLGLGSLPAIPEGMRDVETSWRMRPLSVLLQRLDDLHEQLQGTPRPFHLVVVGGGASGCELSLAIRKRFRAVRDFQITLVQHSEHLLPTFPTRAATLFAGRFRQENITVRTGVRVTGGSEGMVELDGERLPCDTVLWATTAGPPDLIRTSGLPVNEQGFLRVRETLQSVGTSDVFGTGDCIAFDALPNLPRNGVYAVRQGRVLFENVNRFLHERPLRPFQPQRRCLCLLNTADGGAVLSYGSVALSGRWVRWWKDRIDRAWVEKFTRFPAMQATPEGEEPAGMRCGGCGSKISSDVLSAVLGRLDPGDDPRILMGTRAGEDASVHRLQPELYGQTPARLVEVQTVDYFKAFVDDPYLFGRIAALHAVSDLHAMNARPFSALAIVTLPHARGPIQEALLHELLSGAIRSLRADNVVLTGGHTVEGAETALGFAVTGHGEEDRLFTKGGLCVGDLLVMSKPVGSGALLAAWMRGESQAGWHDRLIAGLLQSNAAAAAVLARHGVRACTDITGFGLAGHLLEMLDASKLAAVVHGGQVPAYEGFAEVVGRGIVSTLHRDNAKVARRVEGSSAAWLFDPQTAGGLLAGVRPEAAESVVRELRAAGYERASVVGEVCERVAGAVVVVR